MPNPYHYRAHINSLTRLTTASHPSYVRLRAVTALVRELFAPNPQSDINSRMLRAVDSYELARHQLRDLYDQAVPHAAVARAQAGAVLAEEESTEEDDDPW
jgi:hypothetical protein